MGFMVQNIHLAIITIFRRAICICRKPTLITPAYSLLSSHIHYIAMQISQRLRMVVDVLQRPMHPVKTPRRCVTETSVSSKSDSKPEAFERLKLEALVVTHRGCELSRLLRDPTYFKFSISNSTHKDKRGLDERHHLSSEAKQPEHHSA